MRKVKRRQAQERARFLKEYPAARFYDTKCICIACEQRNACEHKAHGVPCPGPKKHFTDSAGREVLPWDVMLRVWDAEKREYKKRLMKIPIFGWIKWWWVSHPVTRLYDLALIANYGGALVLIIIIVWVGEIIKAKYCVP